MKGVVGRAKGEARRMRLSESSHVMASARARRVAQPVVLEGLGRPEYRLLSYEEAGALLVDERYQRLRVTTMVNDLIHVLSEGGAVLDPITVAQRPDGCRYILDGQQRFWAHSELKRQLPAMIYKVPGGAEGLEVERRAFQVLNTRKAILGDHYVKAWHGPVGEMIRRAESKPDSPLYCRVNFSGTTKRSFGAGVLVRALVAVMGGRAIGAMSRALQVADAILAKPGNEARALAMLALVASVFPAGIRMNYCAALALGEAARARWDAAGRPTLPGEAALKALRRINWLTVAPSTSTKFMPLVRAEIDRR